MQTTTTKLLTLLSRAELQSVIAQCPSKPGTSVTVGMSGGVDSSVSAALLVELGHLNVRGCWMKNWDMVEEEPRAVAACSQEQDLRDAQFVAKHLNIPLHTVDFTKEYWCNVWEPCLKQYDLGKTPNPDTMCNRQIKFDLFLRANPNSIVATGHYARLDGDKRLCRGLDANKDQSYFLSTVLPRRFQQACFPIGGLNKQRVKFLAQQAGLDRIANRPESQGVCFIGERGKRFSSFLEDYLDNPRGRFRSVLNPSLDLGQHQGMLSYTAGQRARVPGLSEANFVVRKDSATGDVWIAPQHHASHQVDWVLARFEREMFDSIEATMDLSTPQLSCQVRYRTPPSQCIFMGLVESSGGGGGKEHVLAKFSLPNGLVGSVPEGQVLALYMGERCLGGGEIVETHHPFFDL